MQQKLLSSSFLFAVIVFALSACGGGGGGDSSSSSSSSTSSSSTSSSSTSSSGSGSSNSNVLLDPIYPDLSDNPCDDGGVVFEAVSCSAADILAAVNNAEISDGGTVCLPACDESLNDETLAIPGGIHVIGAGIQDTILRDTVFVFNADHNGSVGDNVGRLSNMSVINDFNEANSPFVIRSLAGMRIDHAYFEGRFSTFANISLTADTNNAWAVVDHCEFNLFTSYGFYNFANDNYFDNINGSACTDLLGTANGAGGTVFVEDSTFRGFYDHLMDGRRAAHYVFRYNTIDYDEGSGPLEGHGPTDETFADFATGTNVMEIYEVVINQQPAAGSAGILIRSGCGVVFNTSVTGKRWGVTLAVENSPYNWNQRAYPAPQQPHGWWIWGNDFSGTDEEIGILWESDAHIQENRDYYLRAPNDADDGFTYTPYTYPHPVAAGTM